MLVTMRRVDLVVRGSAAPVAMREIHRLGLLHLTPFDAPSGCGPGAFRPGTDDGREARFHEALEELGRLAALLPAAPEPADPVHLRALWELDDEGLMDTVERGRPVLVRAERLVDERGHVTSELARLEGYLRLVDGLRHAVGRLPVLRGYVATGVIVDARHRAVIPLVRDELEQLTSGRCEVIAADLDPEHAAAILFYPTRDAPAVASLLGGRELEEISLPDELQGIAFDELGPRMAQEAARLRDLWAELDRQLLDLSRSHGRSVALLRCVLVDRIAECQALDDAGHSDHLIVVAGWVPEDRLEVLRTALTEAMGDEVLVVERTDVPATSRVAPVAMTNGPLSRSFEPLARFVTVPRYGTIDPTPLLALTFPAFVGIMIGDAAYGLVILAVLVVLRVRRGDSARVRSLWAIGLPIALATIVFGLLFGEVFGEAGSRALGLEPVWIDRRHAVLPLLLVAVVIGVAQVSLGLGLGIVNARRVGHPREMVARATLLVALFAVVVLLAVAAGLLPGELAMVAAAAFLMAAMTSILAVGIAGPIELVGMMGRVLSYARLMAIAMAGVMLALVANELGGLMPNVVFGILVALAIHTLNLTMGLFDASIQGLRLHYVEFFSQFIEPGGIPYAPFASALAGRTSAQRTGGGS